MDGWSRKRKRKGEREGGRAIEREVFFGHLALRKEEER